MKNIFKIITLAKPQRKLIIIVSVLILLGAVLQQLTPLLLKSIVDLIQEEVVTKTGNLTSLYRLLIIVFGVNILSVILESISDRLGDAVSARIGTYLVRHFYHHVLALPQTYFDSNLSGKIANQLTRGILSISDFIGTMSNFILPAILQTVFTIGLLSYYSFSIGLIALAIFPVYIFLSYLSTKRWGKFEIEKNSLEDTYKNRILEVIQNMKLVKTANTQSFEFKKIKSYTHSFLSLYDKQSTGYHFLNFMRNSALEIVLIVIILITFSNTFRGYFTLGVMVLIIQLLNQLRRPLFAMSFILERTQRAEAGAKEFFDIMSIPVSEDLQKSVYIPKSDNITLKMENVSFTYDRNPILKKVNLSINPHETVAFIGPSGAGKTTIVNLLLKLYKPKSGEIYLNSQSYSQLTHSYVRSHFAYVFQDNELFSTSIKENVSYGHKVSHKKIITALKAAYVWDYVKTLPDGINSKIGEKGVKLSGGQKQRLQIARAIVDPAPILVLDEATSSLDAKSEAIIQDAIINLTKHKTVLIIAHRFSTLQHVDRIIVIDQGKIVDSGSPVELASRPGVFKELLRYQLEGNQKLLSKYELIS